MSVGGRLTILGWRFGRETKVGVPKRPPPFQSRNPNNRLKKPCGCLLAAEPDDVPATTKTAAMAKSATVAIFRRVISAPPCDNPAALPPRVPS